MAHWRADDRPDTTMSSEQDSQEAQFDSANLYREDSFTDLRTGSIRRLTPVTADGEPDDSRPVIYQGQAPQHGVDESRGALGTAGTHAADGLVDCGSRGYALRAEDLVPPEPQRGGHQGLQVLQPAVEAREHTIDGLANALLEQ